MFSPSPQSEGAAIGVAVGGKTFICDDPLIEQDRQETFFSPPERPDTGESARVTEGLPQQMGGLAEMARELRRPSGLRFDGAPCIVVDAMVLDHPLA